MSLSFVSSAVLSSTDGVSHNEEKSIETKEIQQLRLRHQSGNKSLFEQLRSNREAEQEKLDEETKMMRMGMRPLDDEDCAHLDTVEQMRIEREQLHKQTVEEELAMFRAAKAERNALDDFEVENDDDNVQNENDERRIVRDNKVMKRKIGIAPVVPKIIAKRKRKRKQTQTHTPTQTQTNTPTPTQTQTEDDKKKKKEIEEKASTQSNTNENTNNSLGGLLGCYYESDSD